MMDYDMAEYTGFLEIAIISFLAAVSPGPDFCIVLKNSLVHSRKSGVLTAVGVCLALIIHLIYTLFGIGLLIVESPSLYSLIKYLGAAYLFYIGLKGIISSFNQPISNQVNYKTSYDQISSYKALSQGFFTNLFNPKAAIFFVSLFSQFIDPKTSIAMQFEFALVNWFITLGWFIFLVYIVTIKQVVEMVHQFNRYVDRFMGCALMLLGFKLLIM
jgi:RhtB (resistance to homoserine/threonine) family protein